MQLGAARQEYEALQRLIASGQLTPQPGRNMQARDYNDAWENAVDRIYELCRELDASCKKPTGGVLSTSWPHPYF
jgi:hypothetical protein